jgi:lipopolysaccharide export LptBFGC system permease protein LptF
MDRLIDPLIADLQVEYAEMQRRRAPWKARWVRLVSLLAFAKVLALAGVVDAWHAFEGTPTKPVRLSVFVFVTATILSTAYFVYAEQSAVRVLNPHASPTLLTIYVVPSALPLTVAIGMTFAIVCGLGAARLTDTLTAGALGGAAVCSIVMLANMTWIVPDSNQAYRELVYGGPVARGDRELTYGNLRWRIDWYQAIGLRPDEVRRLEVTYYGRSAIAAAPVILGMLALAFVRRPRRTTGLRRALTATGICLVYYGLLITAEEAGIWTMWPVAVIMWSPNIACAILAGALAWPGRRLSPTS